MTIKSLAVVVVAVIITASIAFIYRAKTDVEAIKADALPTLELSTTTTNATPGVTL